MNKEETDNKITNEILTARLGMNEHKNELLSKMNVLVRAWELSKGKDGWAYENPTVLYNF